MGFAFRGAESVLRSHMALRNTDNRSLSNIILSVESASPGWKSLLEPNAFLVQMTERRIREA